MKVYVLTMVRPGNCWGDKLKGIYSSSELAIEASGVALERWNYDASADAWVEIYVGGKYLDPYLEIKAVTLDGK